MVLGDWLPAAMAAGGYLLGSIPFGVVVAKCLGTVDPRSAGSRNIGFTNVLRVSGTRAGLLTLAGDAGKGWLVGWVASQSLDQEAWVLVVALSPIVGHMHSIFLGFRGGKGVATALGAVTGVDLAIGGVMLLVWVVTAGVWRYSSGAALAAFAVLPLCAVLLERSGMFRVFSLVVTTMIALRHKDNILRLWQGIEPKIGR
jgi:acyl phosphate:glycerol-3-phosphate acyltransferase